MASTPVSVTVPDAPSSSLVSDPSSLISEEEVILDSASDKQVMKVSEATLVPEVILDSASDKQVMKVSEATSVPEVTLIPKKPLFYQSFMDIVNMSDELDPEYQKSICTVGFTNTLKDINSKGGLTYELVTQIAPYLKRMLCKPQKLLADTEDYYVAEDELLGYYYVCYKWLLMLDMDWPNLNSEDRDKALTSTLHSLPEVLDGKHTLYRVYSSRKGYHIFLVSHRMTRGSKESIELMLEARVDPYYTILSYLRGWSVRVSLKHDEHTCDQLYHYVCSYGDGTLLPECEVALNIHLELSTFTD